MTTLSISETRKQLSDILNRVHYKGETVLIKKHKKNVAAVIPIKDLKLLMRLIEHQEDLSDIGDADASLKEVREKGTTPWEEIKAELGV